MHHEDACRQSENYWAVRTSRDGRTRYRRHLSGEAEVSRDGSVWSECPMEKTMGYTDWEPMYPRAGYYVRPEETATGLNPRYVAYARSFGRTTEEQLSADRESFPGGLMAGFISWIGGKWMEWMDLKGFPRNHIKSEEDHHEFDAWLLDITSEKEKT